MGIGQIKETVSIQEAGKRLGLSVDQLIRQVGDGTIRTCSGYVDGELDRDRVMTDDIQAILDCKAKDRAESDEALKGNPRREYSLGTVTENAGEADEDGTRELAKLLGVDPEATVQASRRRRGVA